MANIVIWGASGHALVVAEIVRMRDHVDDPLRLVGFLDDVNPERRGAAFAGSRILGGREQLDALRPSVEYLIFGFGDNQARLRCADLARAKGFRLFTAIHKRAIVSRYMPIGAGTVIMAGAVVNPGCVIGENVIINTGATIDHECRIRDGAHICPGVHLAGNVTVGEGAFVGIGAAVAANVLIGYKAIVGAGSVVLKDVPYKTVSYGNPAKVARNIRPGDFARLSQ